MKIKYFPDTDSLYIDLSAKTSVDSKEISNGVVVDYDKDGNIVGIDIDEASKKLDMKEIILSKFPSDIQTISA